MLKTIKTDKYMIVFNPKTGQEISSGINGHEDPFAFRISFINGYWNYGSL
jgi:hypothetical protein